jgi:hypothetical protein
MIKNAMRALVLACALPLFLSANYLINDYIISPKAGEQIETMGAELFQKTSIHAYVVATADKIERTANLYEYIKRYEGKLSKPYALIFFAPSSKRIGLLASSEEIKRMYDSDAVKRYAIEIVSTQDSNSVQSRYDVGVVQAYSELADEIAEAKGIELTTTIQDKYHWIITLIRWVVLLGALIIIWIYFGQPFIKRIRHGKQQ